jgi:PAS domain S-box-containing protein
MKSSKKASAVKTAVPAGETPLDGGEIFRGVFEAAGIGMALLDPEGYFKDSNAALHELLGYGGSELRQMTIAEVTFGDDVAESLDLFRQTTAGVTDKCQLEKRYVRRDGEVLWCRLNVTSLRHDDGSLKCNFDTFEDITWRKWVEENLSRTRTELEQRVQERTVELEEANIALEEQVQECQRTEDFLRASDDELRRTNRALRALSLCRDAVIKAEDETFLLEDICRIIVDVGAYRLAWIGYVEEDRHRTVRPVARAGHDDGYVDNLKIALNDPIYSRGPTGICLKSGKPYRSLDIRSDAVMMPWRKEAVKRGYHSSLNLPLSYEGQVLGALVIYSARPDAFDDEETWMLADLADNLAFGITSIRTRARRDRAEQELRKSKEELEVRVEERTEELKSAKEQAELYVDLMGHDINNLNHVAIASLELLQEMLEDEE